MQGRGSCEATKFILTLASKGCNPFFLAAAGLAYAIPTRRESGASRFGNWERRRARSISSGVRLKLAGALGGRGELTRLKRDGNNEASLFNYHPSPPRERKQSVAEASTKRKGARAAREPERGGCPSPKPMRFMQRLTCTGCC